MTSLYRSLINGLTNGPDFTPFGFILIGFVVGHGDVTVLLNSLERTVESLVIPAYTVLVIVYLTAVAFRKELESSWLFDRQRPDRSSSSAQSAVSVVPFEALEEEQPFDLSGAYKLISNDNFEGFLEVQGVPWALRTAANKARPVHRITHRGHTLTIKIEGIIESQTTFTINGPPSETNVRGRIFEDTVTYLEKDVGIVVKKRALTEEYDVTVQRILSQDRKFIEMTSTATFRDNREPVKCVQMFERIE